MSDPLTRTGHFRIGAPSLGWVPQWVRDNLTLQQAIAVGLFLFSGGFWYATYKLRNEMREIRQETSASAAAVVAATKDVPDLKVSVANIEGKVDTMLQLDQVRAKIAAEPLPPPPPLRKPTRRTGVIQRKDARERDGSR